nr:MAG TPA: hypothetical protein [Caudoviricetes sp.]
MRFFIFFKIFSKKLLTNYNACDIIKVTKDKRGNSNEIWEKKI